MPHNFKLVDEVRYDKSKPFDPKTMPIADYWKKFECACGEFTTEVGYRIDGQDCAYGQCLSFSPCPLDKGSISNGKLGLG